MGCPSETSGHLAPQPEQLSGSLVMSTHALPHVVRGRHEKSQFPLTQIAVPNSGAVHTAPQPSQLVGSDFRFTHLPPQTVWPSLQTTAPSVPPVEVPSVVPLPAEPPVPALASPWTLPFGTHCCVAGSHS